MHKDKNKAISIRKSNEFVTAKYQTTLLGNQIVAIALTKLQEENGILKAVLSPSEIRSLLKLEDDVNIYRKLKSIAKNLAGHQIFLEDGAGNFKMFNMITNADYKDSELVIRFNVELTPSLFRLRGQYTTYELATLTSFTSNHTYRLYEILKKDAWRIKENPDAVYTRVYGLNELKCMIGLVNTDLPYIAKAIQEKKSWDEIVEKICKKEDKKFDVFNDFRSRVLLVAQKEMREKSDIRFEFETERSGRGGKVRTIIFHIYANDLADDAENEIASTIKRMEKTVPEYVEESRRMVETEEWEIYREICDYLESKGIDTYDLDEGTFFSIYRDANKNVGVIRQEIDYSLTVPEIHNYFGWLRSAVKERYSQNPNVETIMGSSERARKVKEVMETPVSEEALEDLWNNYKDKPEFEDFLMTLELPDVELLEKLYPPSERIKLFIDFKMNRKK